MCYSALIRSSLKDLERDFGAVSVKADFDDLQEQAQAHPQAFATAAQIFPGTYAPLIVAQAGQAQNLIRPLRYGAYVPAGANERAYTSYNARRDNLSSRFWDDAFLHHHGVVVLRAFYEWVEVAELLTAGRVTLAQVKREFDRQRAQRQARVLAAGKAYKPTATEQKDPRQRKIIIQFRPEDGRDLITPAIINYRRDGDRWRGGFAIVTDEPPPFVTAAGHDRCPVLLCREALDDWLHCQGRSAKDMDAVLARQDIPFLEHSLPDAS